MNELPLKFKGCCNDRRFFALIQELDYESSNFLESLGEDEAQERLEERGIYIEAILNLMKNLRLRCNCGIG
jgi:hypothetical protein